jgi:hypothetical protein
MNSRTSNGVRASAPPTVARLEQALVSLAWLVDTYGQQYTPLYEAAEKWLAEAQASEATRDRIKRTLAANRNRLPIGTDTLDGQERAATPITPHQPPPALHQAGAAKR